MNKRPRGFILIFAMLTLATISTIVVSVLIASRSRVKIVANIKAATEAEAIADGVVAIAVLTRWRELQQGSRIGSPLPWNGEPVECLGPRGERLGLTVQDEGGKVDMNAASELLLEKLVTGVAGSQITGRAIAGDIALYRRKAAEANGGVGIVTIDELFDIVAGTPGLAIQIKPYLTVHSRIPGIDGTLASPELRRLLSASSAPDTIPAELQMPSASRAFRLTAVVRLAAGGSFVRDTLVEFGTDDGRLYVHREWLRSNQIPKWFAHESPLIIANPDICSAVFPNALRR
jgi:general secretion pathway protein K